MKKVLFIVTKSENGGAQKWVKEQVEILKDKFELYLVTDEEGWLVRNTEVSKYMTDIKIRKRFSISFLIEFYKFLKDNNIDLIVASSANAGIYSRLSKIFYRTKVIYVGHGWSSIYNGGRLKWLFTRIEKILGVFTDSILCVSESDYNRAKNEIGINEKKLKLIKNKIMPMPRQEQEENIPPKILSVARFRAPKRNDLIIESVKTLDVELFMVGDGPLREKLEKLKNDKIHFLGEIDGFDEFYKYDVFVLISESEGMPLSAIEAMSAGLPLVLSNVGGCPELIEGNGVLVENDIDSIVDGIKTALNNRKEYSKKSLKFFDENFNLLKFKNEFINYYLQVMNIKIKE